MPYFLSISQLFGDKDVPGEELHEILREIDTNMNGQVELDEYLQVGRRQSKGWFVVNDLSPPPLHKPYHVFEQIGRLQRFLFIAFMQTINFCLYIY